MAEVNAKWQSKGIAEVSMRIGIHQGKAVVGNFGSPQRVDYTAVDQGIPASRMSPPAYQAKFVSPEISELLSPELTEQAGEYELKGISGKTSPIGLLGNRDL